MADESWVFDSLICFLHSPAWNASLSTFIEEKSIIFDPNIEIDISNPEYIAVHNEYKNLVDFMLGSFMEEMNITTEQFELACLEGKNLQALANDEPSDSHSFSFHKGLFQQIWAANDIRIFVRMMIQRNVELQLQALDLIERRQNENASSSIEMENVEIEKSIHIETKIDDRNELDSDKFKRLNLFFEQDRIKNSDLLERQEYLLKQRDKILSIKKQARARQLNEATKARPSSASLSSARKVIQGEQIEAADGSVVELRKILAKKLRDEVVDQTSSH
ncbi:CLUMA_CG020351, isoform A [Clunio marinus]|uniref:Cilia- and flagella-associated protein 36 n=1 Tax=Clunio marinus TaxID=568069 RepID=A0A1J1J7D2_9DIPT|nr:CLUMA_CG020351, isoform A [Clunio marinus]